MSEERETHILRLPMELLEHIAGYCDIATDILALRLTCSALAGAAFEAFAKEYIEHLECFILDPGRLGRIINILDQPHLARKVVRPNFSISPYSDARRIQSAANEGETYMNARAKVRTQYALQEYEKHECAGNGISTQSWTLLENILQRLAQLPHSLNCLEFRLHEAGLGRVAEKRPNLITEILDLARSNKCIVGGITMDNTFDIDPTDFLPGGKLSHIMKNLRMFSYSILPDLGATWDESIEAIQTPKALRQHELVMLLCNVAPKLEEFRLFLYPGSLSTKLPYVQLSQKLLSGPTMPALRTVDFSVMQVCLYDLLDFFDRCRDSIICLNLRWVNLPESGDPWIKVLRAVRAFPRLKTLELHHLTIHPPTLGMNEKVKFVVPGHAPHERFWSMDEVDGGFGAKDFLDMNLTHGLLYENRYRSIVWKPMRR